MATRPAWTIINNYVIQESFEFKWNGGLDISQKQKNIANLHNAIFNRYGEQSLEVSSKSKDDIGKNIGAFNIKLDGYYLENIFQSSKVYEFGGPYMDLLEVKSKEAKQDKRHLTSGKLIGFKYNGYSWNTTPKTAFYDFIYLKALIKYSYKNNLSVLENYDWFTDIEFNPKKSINCQARSVAIYKLIATENKLDILNNCDKWLKFHSNHVL